MAADPSTGTSSESSTASSSRNASSSAPSVAAGAPAGTRQRVLDAAADHFLEHGYAATSVRSIAAACGVRAASIYHHFDSKEAILAEVLSIGMSRIADAVAPSLEDRHSPFPQRLGRAISAHLHALLDLGAYTACHTVVFPTAPEHVREDGLADRDRYERLWHDFLDAAQREGAIRPDVDLGLARLQLLGSMNATLGWYRPGRHSVDSVASSYAAIFLRGMDGASTRDAASAPAGLDRARRTAVESDNTEEVKSEDQPGMEEH